MMVDWSVYGCFGHISMVGHSISDGCVCLPYVLFVADGTFQQVDCAGGIT